MGGGLLDFLVLRAENVHGGQEKIGNISANLIRVLGEIIHLAVNFR